MTCPQCGTINSENAQYCGKCGVALAAAQEGQTAPTPAAEETIGTIPPSAVHEAQPEPTMPSPPIDQVSVNEAPTTVVPPLAAHEPAGTTYEPTEPHAASTPEVMPISAQPTVVNSPQANAGGPKPPIPISAAARQGAGSHGRAIGLLAVAVLVAAAILVVVGIKVFKKDNNNAAPGGNGGSTSGIAAQTAQVQALPASTVLFASFNPVPGGDQSTNLQTIKDAFTTQPGFDVAMKMLTNQTNSSCVDVNKQILSWIDGPVTLAFTDPSALSSASSGSATGASAMTKGLAVLITVKSGSTVPDILTTNKLGTATQVGTYSGASMYTLKLDAGCSGSSTSSSSSPAYAAIVNNQAIVAGSQATLQAQIDLASGKGAALSSNANYKNLTAKLPPNGIAYMYIDTPAIIKATSGSALGALSGSGSPLGGLAGGASSVQGITDKIGPTGISLTAQSNGIDLQAVQLTTAPIPNAASVTPNKGADALPNGTIFYLSLNNLKGLINSAIQAAQSASPTSGQQLAQVTTVFGKALDLMDGEFALGVLPVDPSAVKSLGLQDTTGLPLAAMFDISAHSDAATTISGLLTAFGGSGGPLSFTASKSAQGNDVYTSSGGYGYAIVKGWLVISTSIKKVTASIENVLYNSGAALSSGNTYKLALSSLANKNGVMFLDLGQLRTTLEAALLAGPASRSQTQYQQAKPLLVPLRALEVSGGTEDGGTTIRLDMLVVISK